MFCQLTAIFSIDEGSVPVTTLPSSGISMTNTVNPESTNLNEFKARSGRNLAR